MKDPKRNCKSLLGFVELWPFKGGRGISNIAVEEQKKLSLPALTNKSMILQHHFIYFSTFSLQNYKVYNYFSTEENKAWRKIEINDIENLFCIKWSFLYQVLIHGRLIIIKKTEITRKNLLLLIFYVFFLLKNWV